MSAIYTHTAFCRHRKLPWIFITILVYSLPCLCCNNHFSNWQSIMYSCPCEHMHGQFERLRQSVQPPSPGKLKCKLNIPERTWNACLWCFFSLTHACYWCLLVLELSANELLRIYTLAKSWRWKTKWKTRDVTPIVIWHLIIMKKSNCSRFCICDNNWNVVNPFGWGMRYSTTGPRGARHVLVGVDGTQEVSPVQKCCFTSFL